MLLTICELDRSDAIATGHEDWASMNRVAATCIERCIRVCKFKLFRAPEPMVRAPHLQPEMFLKECVDGRFFAPRSMDLAMHLCGGDRDRAARVLSVQSNLQIFALPECVALQQLESLDRIHSGCSAKIRACQRITFCSICAINGKGFGSKLRICCLTKKVSCVTCPPDTVVTVNMVGTLLKVSSAYFYLCPSCVSIRAWASDSDDLCPWLLFPATGSDPKCRCHGAVVPASSTHEQACIVCRSKNLCSRGNLLLPDVRGRVMKRVHLCNRWVAAKLHLS